MLYIGGSGEEEGGKAKLLDKYNGTPGYYIQTFLADDRINRNNWQLTWESIRTDGPAFLGKPGVINPELDHPVDSSYEKATASQEKFRVATIIDVILDESQHSAHQVSETSREIYDRIDSGELQYVSPAIWPRSLADVEILRHPTKPSEHVHRIHRFKPMHYAFVAEPAYGKGRANINRHCNGTAAQCSSVFSYAAAVSEGEQSFTTIIPICKEDPTNKCMTYGVGVGDAGKSCKNDKMLSVLGNASRLNSQLNRYIASMIRGNPSKKTLFKAALAMKQGKTFKPYPGEKPDENGYFWRMLPGRQRIHFERGQPISQAKKEQGYKKPSDKSRKKGGKK